jgi:hypothetical protein
MVYPFVEETWVETSSLQLIFTLKASGLRSWGFFNALKLSLFETLLRPLRWNTSEYPIILAAQQN